MGKSITIQNLRRGGQNASLWLAISIMSVVLFFFANVTPAFSDSQTSKFQPHPGSGKYSAIACRFSGSPSAIQFSGNATTAARTFFGPSEIIGGNLRSNTDIKISGNALVNGDATPAPAHVVNKTGNATVTGSIEPATELLDCSIGDLTQLISWVKQHNDNASIPPTDQGRMPWGCEGNPPPNDPWQFCLKGNEIIHLSAGTYWFSSWSQSGNSKIIVDGYVRIVVTGTIGLSSNVSINADGNPYNLLVFAVPESSYSLQVSGNSIFNGLMYAPAVATQLSGQSTINGNLIIQEIGASGQAKLKRWIEEIPPVITVTLPSTKCLNSSGISFNFTAADYESGIEPESLSVTVDGIAVDFLEIQGDPFLHTIEASASLAGLTDGNHQIIIKAIDRAGNYSEYAKEIIIDTTAPSVAIQYPADGIPMQQPILAILGVANDNFAEACGLTLTLNGVPVEVQPDGQWMSTLLLDEGQMITITAIATDGTGNSASHQISASYIRYPGPLLMFPMFLSVDPDGNGVFEVSDQGVKIKPHWANILGMPHNVTGFIGEFGGPPGPTYSVLDTYASYDTIDNHTIENCDKGNDCYTLQLSAAPSPHRDSWIRENLTVDNQADGSYYWPAHIGNSFPGDVSTTSVEYRSIETLLHYGIAGGCEVNKFCPDAFLSRGQLAIMLARTLAVGDNNIPWDGTVWDADQKKFLEYNCTDIAGIPFKSLFEDITKGSIFCRYVHYLYAAGIVKGCTASPLNYCPSGNVTRAEAAQSIADAITFGNETVPATYSEATKSETGAIIPHFYSCDESRPDYNHFNDVDYIHPGCRHIHYLWARGIIEDVCCTSGDPCPAYCFYPASSITRGQFAKMLVSSFELELYKANIQREEFCPYSGALSWGHYWFLNNPALSDAGIDRAVNLMYAHGMGRGFRTFVNVYFDSYDVTEGDLPIHPYELVKDTSGKYTYDLSRDNGEYWHRVERLVKSMQIAGFKRKPFFTLGHRYQVCADDNTGIGPWCRNINSFTDMRIRERCSNIPASCTKKILISGNWISKWYDSDFACEKEFIKCEYKRYAQRLKDLGVDTVEIYNEPPTDDISIDTSINAHKELIGVIPGNMKIQVNFNAPRVDCDPTVCNQNPLPCYCRSTNPPCEYSTNGPQRHNYTDANFKKAWNTFTEGAYKVDYFAVHGTRPANVYWIPQCANDPQIGIDLIAPKNDDNERMLELSSDGQHPCFQVLKHGNSHHLNAEVLKELMDYKESSTSPYDLYPALNFEMDVINEIPVVVNKMRNVCFRDDIPSVDARVNCWYEGPVIDYPCNSDDFEIAWTAMNVDPGKCTIHRLNTGSTQNVRERSSDTYKIISPLDNETFIFKCLKGSQEYIDKVSIYCK